MKVICINDCNGKFYKDCVFEDRFRNQMRNI